MRRRRRDEQVRCHNRPMSAGPEKSSSRAEGWIWGAINPLLESLQAENRFLADGNLTFRARMKQPEWIHRAADYLDPNGQILLEDLVDEHPTAKAPIAAHDAAYDSAATSARQSWAKLTGDPAFRESIRVALEEYIASRGHPVSERSVFPDGKAELIVAERLVNQIEHLGNEHADSEFWDASRSTFIPFRERAAFGQYLEALTAFKERSDELIDFLKTMRRSLSREYGVAPAPYRRA